MPHALPGNPRVLKDFVFSSEPDESGKVSGAAVGFLRHRDIVSFLKILIAVVIGALLLSGLYALFNTTIMPTVTSKITQLFNFAG